MAASTIFLAAAFSAALFGVMDATVLRPLPFPESGRIVRLDLPHSRLVVSPSLYDTLPGVVAALPVEEPTFLQRRTAFDFGESSATSDARAVFVSPSFFRLFGAVPNVGRPLIDEDVGLRPRRAVVAHSYWVRHLGGTSDILRQVVSMPGDAGLGDEPIEIVGVLPPDFEFPHGTTIWLAHSPSEFLPTPVPTFVRLKHGTHIETIRSALPDVNVQSLREYATHRSAKSVGLLVLGSMLLFLVTWTQLAASFVGQARDRAQELRVRHAMGAQRAHLLWISIRRVIGIALCSIVVSTALTGPLTAGILATLPAEASAGHSVSAGSRTVQFVVALHLLGLLLAAPVVVSVVRLATTRHGSHFSSSLALLNSYAFRAQIGLTAMLLVITGASLRTYAQIDRVAWGIDPKDLHAFALPMPNQDESSGGVDLRTLRVRWQDSLLAVRNLAEVESAAMAASWPISPATQRMLVPPGPDDRGAYELDVYRVGHGWVRTVKGRLLEGGEPAFEDVRPITQSGRVSRSALINSTLLTKLGSEGSPVDKTIALSEANTVRITGVLGDISDGDFSARPRPAVFAYAADDSLNILLVRLRPSGTVESVHQALDDIWGQGRSERRVVSLESVAWSAGSEQRSRAFLMSLAAAFALPSVLAGVVWAVRDLMRRRSHDLAVRFALGATEGSIRRLLAAELLCSAGLSAATGGLAGAGLLALVAHYTPGVGQASLAVSVTAVAALVASTLAAARVGTRSLSGVDPVSLLKAAP